MGLLLQFSWIVTLDIATFLLFLHYPLYFFSLLITHSLIVALIVLSLREGLALIRCARPFLHPSLDSRLSATH